jgi:hypothetical protein
MLQNLIALNNIYADQSHQHITSTSSPYPPFPTSHQIKIFCNEIIRNLKLPADKHLQKIKYYEQAFGLY